MRQLVRTWPSVRPSLGAAALALSVAACGGDDTITEESDGGTGKAGSSCPEKFLTQQCSCSAGLSGSQYCTASGWSECECQLPGGGTVKGNGTATMPGSSGSTPAGNLRTDITFDWQRTPPVQGSCEPGYYEGTFSGLYASQLTFVNAPIPVAAVSIPGKPGLSFTLSQAPDSGEQLVIQNGVMDGLADGAFPFEGTLTGSLDCNTLKFNAILDGYYSLGVQGVGMFKFKGPLVADYDKINHQVINATWNVLEYDPPPANFVTPAGGQGTWSATWLHP